MAKFNIAELLPIIEETLERGESFKLPITGTSMNPLLIQGRDFALISKARLPLEIGDVPLYRRKDGAFVLHRVVDIKENGEYILCGDNQFLLESGIFDDNIIGIANAFIIKGKEVNAETDPKYLKHKEKFIKNIKRRHPFARLRYKLYRLRNGK